MLNGYSGYSPPSYARQSRELWTLPSPPALALLRRLGIRFVVVHATVAGTPWAGLRSPRVAAPLHYLGSFGGDELYEVPGTEPGHSARLAGATKTAIGRPRPSMRPS